MSLPPAPAPPFAADRVRTGLGLILWGGLIVVVDVNRDGGLDLVNDWVGWPLVWWGLVLLIAATAPSPPRRWLWAVAALSLVYAPLSATSAGDPTRPPDAAAVVLSVVALVAAVAFCVALRGLTAQDPRLAAARRSWQRSLWLIALLWGIADVLVVVGLRADLPLLLLHQRPGTLAVGVLLLAALDLAALAHLALSTVRTRRALDNRVDHGRLRPAV